MVASTPICVSHVIMVKPKHSQEVPIGVVQLHALIRTTLSLKRRKFKTKNNFHATLYNEMVKGLAKW